MKPIIASLAVLATLLPGAALAQMANCAPREIVTERLESRFGESFAGGGLQTSESILEVWMSAEAGTWTILLTRANGVSCVMASGTDWRDGMIAEAAKGIPS